MVGILSRKTVPDSNNRYTTYVVLKILQSRIAGIEPAHAVLKTAVLPLNYTPSYQYVNWTCTNYGYLFNGIFPYCLNVINYVMGSGVSLTDTLLVSVDLI